MTAVLLGTLINGRSVTQRRGTEGRCSASYLKMVTAHRSCVCACSRRRSLAARVSVLLIAAALLAACGSAVNVTARNGPSKQSAPTTEAAARRFPPRVLRWLRTYNAHSSPGRATSASWVLTTHDKSGPFVGGAIFPDRTPVYLFDLERHFVWDHSCPPSSPPSACRSVGAHEVLTLDAHLLEIKDFGIASRPADLATLGIVGHVAL